MKVLLREPLVLVWSGDHSPRDATAQNIDVIVFMAFSSQLIDDFFFGRGLKAM